MSKELTDKLKGKKNIHDQWKKGLFTFISLVVGIAYFKLLNLLSALWVICLAPCLIRQTSVKWTHSAAVPK